MIYVGFFVTIYIDDYVIYNTGKFSSSFSSCVLSVYSYLSPLIKPVRTSSTKLNRNDKGKHFSFIPKFKGNIHHQERPVATEGLEGCLGQDVSEEVQTCLYWERTQDKNLIAIYEKKFSGIFMFFLLPDLWKSCLSYFPKLILIQKLVYYPKVTCNIVMKWGTDSRLRVSGS